jgi:error-prone DNA polymerase
MASRIIEASAVLSRLSHEKPIEPVLSRSDSIKHPDYASDPVRVHPRDVRILPRSRDFH